MRILICVALILSSGVASGEYLGQWLAANEPRVENYLMTLSPKEINHRISGVTLTDKTVALKGYVFLANKSKLNRGIHDYEFKASYGGVIYETNYIWLDSGHQKVNLPHYLKCPGKFIEPGGIAVLSGDQYTYSYLHPGGNMVVTMCKLKAQQDAPADRPTAAQSAGA